MLQRGETQQEMLADFFHLVFARFVGFGYIVNYTRTSCAGFFNHVPNSKHLKQVKYFTYLSIVFDVFYFVDPYFYANKCEHHYWQKDAIKLRCKTYTGQLGRFINKSLPRPAKNQNKFFEISPLRIFHMDKILIKVCFLYRLLREEKL